MTVNQKKRMKKSGDRNQDRQDEEDQGKTSKLIAYLSTKCETCMNETSNALSNSQTGILENPIVCNLKLIRMVSN